MRLYMTDQAIIKNNEALQNATNSDVYKPLPSQIVWLDTALQLETDSITDIEQACGIDRTQWYRWLDRPGFIDWYNNTWNEKLRGHAWKLDIIGMKQGKKDFNYWKAMQQRVGNLTEKPTVALQVNTVINEKKNEYGI